MLRALLLCCLFCPAWLSANKPKAGTYRGSLLLRENNALTLPFNFVLSYKGKKPFIVIHNADEKITVDETRTKGDSLFFRMPVFDTEFRTKITPEGLEGIFVNHYRTNERIIKFRATYGEEKRFPGVPRSNTGSVEGTWECEFSPHTSEMSKAAGKFHHIEQTPYISGTFLTETGDYRFLEGILSGDTLQLSAFDGGHAFLFTAVLKGDSLKSGMFYSGSHWQEPWTGKKNPSFVLRDPDKIAYLRDSSQRINFAFRNTKGKTVTLDDKKFLNRPVIIQIMGSWCPNCMDESRYLSGLYKEYRGKGLEIVALAFEKTSDEKKGRELLARLKEKLGIEYDILFTGVTGKDAASKALPAISEISAFPTTIFLNREHKVVRIHTGFSGPATGGEYDKFKKSTGDLVNQLLK